MTTMADHKQVLVAYRDRKRILKIPQECGVDYVLQEIRKTFHLDSTSSVFLQQYNATFEEYVDIDSDSEVGHNEKLKVVTLFNQVSLVIIIK